jgi:beta-carotene hydroxylase
VSVSEAATPAAGGRARASAALTEESQAVVRRLSGGIGWPTVLLMFALAAVQVGIIVLWAVGVVPMALGFVVNSFVAYSFYTVHHDATHKSISGRNPRWRWLDAACGNVAGFALQLDFGSYSRNHLRHHAHTNTPADPDLMVKGPMWQLPIKWGIGMLFMVIGALPGGDRVVDRLVVRLGLPLPAAETDRDKADRTRLRRFGQVGLVLLLATIPFGSFWPAFFLWWLPSRVGILFLMVLFQWLPHFPFDRTDRFGATRVNRFPGSTWLLLQQDRHLIHHLYPSIPWYRYRAAFRELRPLLEAHGAIIQGTGSSPRVPIQLREEDR